MGRHVKAKMKWKRKKETHQSRYAFFFFFGSFIFGNIISVFYTLYSILRGTFLYFELF